MPKTPEQVIRDEVRALTAYHVPDSAGMTKLDAMENPYALPEELRNELAGLITSAELNRYPDAAATRLRARLRESLGLTAESELLLGNGSDEIILMLMLAVARPGAVVLGVEPSFVMFRLIARWCGMRFESVALRPDFQLDVPALHQAIAHHDPALIFIAYPNNPTGNLFDAQAIESIIAKASGLVVVDEAYYSFAGKSFMPRLPAYPNLLVMRTLSKSGLAGLRLGLIAGAAAWLRHVDKVRLPYNINVLTQLVAEKVLQNQPLLDRQADAIKTERARVLRELGRVPGVHAYPSDANFILFRTVDADRVFGGLKRRGVLIKNLHGSHDALSGCLRVTIGTPAENEQFLEALGLAVTD
jgi:histidinol-phosphate aminotransferase